MPSITTLKSDSRCKKTCHWAHVLLKKEDELDLMQNGQIAKRYNCDTQAQLLLKRKIPFSTAHSVVRCKPPGELLTAIMDWLQGWKSLRTLTGTTAVCTMFLKRPTEGSTSSAKGRTVQLSESTEEKTEHLPSKDMKEPMWRAGTWMYFPALQQPSESTSVP